MFYSASLQSVMRVRVCGLVVSVAKVYIQIYSLKVMAGGGT